MVVRQSAHDRRGDYEVIDGAHRLVALCLAQVEDVDAYVAHMQQ